jgi:hypothetical protein
MIDADLATRLDALEKKIDAIHVSVQKTRRYIWWSGVMTFLFFVLPIIGLAFVIPSFIANYTTQLQGIYPGM